MRVEWKGGRRGSLVLVFTPPIIIYEILSFRPRWDFWCKSRNLWVFCRKMGVGGANMYNFDIEEMILNGEKLKFDKGYLLVEVDGHQKSWKGELFGIHPSVAISSSSAECKIKTNDEQEFRGSIIINSYQNLPLGDKMSFLGDGMLEKVNKSTYH